MKKDNGSFSHYLPVIAEYFSFCMALLIMQLRFYMMRLNMRKGLDCSLVLYSACVCELSLFT